MSIYIFKCLECKNFIKDEGTTMRCKAFPEGIPDEKMLAPDDKQCNGEYKFSPSSKK